MLVIKADWSEVTGQITCSSCKEILASASKYSVTQVMNDIAMMLDGIHSCYREETNQNGKLQNNH